jgi:predicted ferric reductase
LAGGRTERQEAGNMLWTIVAILLLLWVLGLALEFAGQLIHILLVIAAIIIVFRLLTGRRVA